MDPDIPMKCPTNLKGKYVARTPVEVSVFTSELTLMASTINAGSCEAVVIGLSSFLQPMTKKRTMDIAIMVRFINASMCGLTDLS